MSFWVIKMLLYEKNQVLERIDINQTNKSNKDINIKNLQYYFFNDMINVKHFDINLLPTDKI